MSFHFLPFKGRLYRRATYPPGGCLALTCECLRAPFLKWEEQLTYTL